MSFFTQTVVNQLYLAEERVADRGSLALVLPRSSDRPGIDLDEALHSATLAGIFVCSARKLAFASVEEAQTFVREIFTRVGTGRALLWLTDPSHITNETAPLMGISSDGTKVTAELLAPLTPTLSLHIQKDMKLALDPTQNTLLQLGASSGPRVEFSGPSRPDTSIVTSGTLPLSGPLRGSIQFSIFIQRRTLHSRLNWGFQSLFPYKGPVQSQIREWLPLASPDSPNGADMLGFQVNIDPSDVFNEVFDPCLPDEASCDLLQAYGARRTFFTFTGQNRGNPPEATILVSYYRTIYGDAVCLRPVRADEASLDVLPARLVFTHGELTSDGSEAFSLAPEGDFLLEVQANQNVPGAEEKRRYDLLCGLHGDEFLRFTPRTATSDGDRLRFLSRCPAFAPTYPFRLASPVEAPIAPNAPLLTPSFRTSWATLVRKEDAHVLPYVAQPQGAALFGKDNIIQPVSSSLLGHVTPVNQRSVDANLLFPLLPYAGVKPGDGVMIFSKEQIEAFEREVIAPTRRSAIGAMTAPRATPSRARQNNPARGADLLNVTTPSGVIVTLAQDDNHWSKILLGQNTQPQLRQMSFSEPDDQLMQAFQTNQLFLVIANATHLGQFIAEGESPGPAFCNRMAIEDWVLQADVGQQNRYGDYKNVIIVKGRKGTLYDPQKPAAENLIANPEQWSQSAAFAAPTTTDQPDLPDQSQLVILSQWLQDFFQDAHNQSDQALFAHFNQIASDENWTGLLVLNMQIQQVPDTLKGLLAGIAHPDTFFAHHFGINISQVQIAEGGAGLKDSSSMFGLISYVDPDSHPPQPDQEPQPIPSITDKPYDFRVLTLQVLFENTAIKQFRSYAQLTLNEFFGTAVDHMGKEGNPYNALVLRGSYQNNNGQHLYSLSSIGPGAFYLKSNVLKKIEVTNVQMSTRNPGSEDRAISWFALNGFLDYGVLQQTQAGETVFFDLFAFGNLPGVDLPRMGLSFTNLGLQMTFSLAEAHPQPDFAFRTEEMTFDLATSTPRPGSLLTSFNLQLQGLVSSDKETSPAKAGYVPVIPDFRLGGVDGSPWYGLRFRLDMGTPGELAGKVGLNAYLLAAWSPDSTGEANYRAIVGLELPGTGGGAKLISLQTVLKLSLGRIRLIYIKEQQTFLLLFTEIALRFLGLLKIPPNGSTLFYLFGKPQSRGQQSELGWYAMYRKQPQSLALKREGASEEHGNLDIP